MPSRVTAVLLLCGLAACAGTPPSPSSHPLSLEETIAALERETASDPDDGRAWLRLGEARETLALQAEAEDGDPFDALAGAATAFERAASLLREEAAPRLALARMCERRGDLEGAAARAAEALSLDLAPGAARREANQVLARAVVGWIESGRERLDPLARDALVRRGRAALASLDTELPPLAETARLRARLERALGRAETARRIALDGIDLFPEEVPLHLLVRDSFAEETLPSPDSALALRDLYETLHARHPESRTTLRFLAAARGVVAEHARRAGRWVEAAEGFAAAQAAFERAEAFEAGGPTEDARRAAACIAAQGWCRIGTGEFERAGRLFLAAANRGTLDGPDASGATPREGIETLARAWLEAGEPRHALDFLEEAAGADPESPAWSPIVGEVCFRSALAEEAAGREEEARTLFERALACYERILRDHPGDLNGSSVCARLLSQHLRRDFDRAELLLRAVAQIADDRLAIPGVPEEEREALASRAAAAWEDLGMLYFDERNDPRRALEFFQKSLRYNPEPGTRVRWYLEKIGAAPETGPATRQGPG